MRKYSFLVYRPEYEHFLIDIQEQGVLHVIEKENEEISDELRQKYTLLKKFDDAIKSLKKREVEKTEQDHSVDGLTLLNNLDDYNAQLDKINHDLAAIAKEMKMVEPWGDFSMDILSKLLENQVQLHFFICSSKSFDKKWVEEHDALVVSEEGGFSYFVIVEKNGAGKPEIDAEEIPAFKHSLSELAEQEKVLNAEIDEINAKLDDIAAKQIEELENSKSFVENSSAFDAVLQHTGKEADEKIMVLEGWVPKDKTEAVEDYLKKKTIVHIAEEPAPEDKPPILLKNNRFAKLYEPIGELYTMPDYKELDLTPFFAPFFMMFFGFCLGDAGYGLLILIATLILRFKVKKQLKPIMTLGAFLGLATVIMGIVSGTFFGILLLKHEIAWLEPMKKVMLDEKKLMALAIGVGGVQIIFGMFIKAFNIIRVQGFKYALSTFGWIIAILGLGGVFALNKLGYLDAQQFKITMISVGSFAGLFIFFLNSPGKNPFLNFGLGLWDTYGMASGLLGDILSYIRLFALGISSAVLGNVFNQLAVEFSTGLPIIVSQLVLVLILAFGHSLNLFMAALGSFVHPLRLTFVEFYKNAGFAGGGKQYQPFRKSN